MLGAGGSNKAVYDQQGMGQMLHLAANVRCAVLLHNNVDTNTLRGERESNVTVWASAHILVPNIPLD